MTLKKHWLMTGAAVVIALGAGYGGARILDRSPTEAEHAEAGHTEEASGEGFITLTPQEAARAFGF